MADTKKPFPDPLVRQRLFPDPQEIFGFLPRSLSDALKDGIIAVDTNVLLVPYTTGRASLEQIQKTYSRLAAESRLRIPGQVVREFADNRAEKLKDLFQNLSRKRDISLPVSGYPLLEGIPAYSNMVKREKEISKALDEYRKIVGTLLDTVSRWHWDDPVSQIYRDIFSPSTIIDPEFVREELLKELTYRQEHEIPPGYKDRNNEYSGIGDLLIWKTLLKIGEKESRDLIFVSGDEKSDWRYRSENRALYPRFELLDEYRRASKGKTLLIISFGELLEQFGVPAPVVAEVKQEEVVSGVASGAHRFERIEISVNNAVYHWLSAQYPSSLIDSTARGIDFIVYGPEGIEGYEWKLVRPAESANLALKQVAHYVQNFATGLPISIVLVLGEHTKLDTTSDLLETLEQRAFESQNIRRVVIGKLSEPLRFEELYRIDLKK